MKFPLSFMIPSLEVQNFKKNSSRGIPQHQPRLMSEHHDTISRSVTFLVIFFLKFLWRFAFMSLGKGLFTSSLHKDRVPQEKSFCKILFILFHPTYSKRMGNWKRGSFWTQHEYRACNCHVTFSLNLSLSYSSSRNFKSAAVNAEGTTLFQLQLFKQTQNLN